MATVSGLTKKLSKIASGLRTYTNNGYNMQLLFELNGKYFSASYEKGKDLVEDFSTTTGYDSIDQEYERRFFRNLNQVLAYASR